MSSWYPSRASSRRHRPGCTVALEEREDARDLEPLDVLEDDAGVRQSVGDLEDRKCEIREPREPQGGISVRGSGALLKQSTQEGRMTMMSKLLKPPSRMTSRDQLAGLADTKWRNLAKSVEEGLGNARAALGDPGMQAETRALLSELASAFQRTREIGLTRAFDDKLVARRLSTASRHASHALDAARGRRRRRNTWWRTLAVTGGVALTVGSGYAAWKMQSKNESPR